MRLADYLTGARAGLALLLAALLVPAPAPAQIAFRGSSSGAGPVGAIAFRAPATTGVAGTVTFRDSSRTTSILTPAFRAAAQASAGNGVLSLTIAKPAGTIQLEVMVAAIGVSASTPTIVAPPGWVLVRKLDNTAANANSLAVYYKIATALEPTAYTWTFSASGGAAGGIQTFRFVDIANPIDAENGQTTLSGTSHATPGIATTVANTMLVTAYTFSSSRAWNNPPLAPAAPAVTERVDVRSNGNNNTGQSTAAHQGVVAAAGAVPALTASTAVAGGSADVGNTHVLALRPAAEVPRPNLTAPGDLMVAAIAVQPATATLTPPAGWTLVRRIDNPVSSNSLAIYSKFAAGGEPPRYFWQVSGGTAFAAGIQSFYGVDQADPIDVENGLPTPIGLQHTAPAITTTVANAMLVGNYTFASSASFAPVDPDGGGPLLAMTETYDQSTGAAGNAGQTLEGTRIVKAAPGLSAAYRSDASNDADAGAAHMMALRPAPMQISIPKPATVVENDTMIAAIGLTPSSVTITPPPGWTSVRRTNNGGGVTNALEVFYKVATNSEPAGYVWTFSAAASAVGGIQAYSGVNTANPIIADAGQTTPSGSAHAAPTVDTGAVANAMLVGHYTLSSSTTWAAVDPPGPPVAMTESFDVLFPPNGATGQSLQGTRQTQAAAGVSTAFSSNAAGGGNADFGNTHMLALRPQATNQINLPKPPGTVANDVMIAAIGFQPRTLTITPPAGWQLIQRMDNAAGTGNSLAVYRLTAGVSEPAVYEWTFSGALTAAAGGIQSFSGVDTGNPVDAAAGQTTPSSTTHTTPGITTTIASTMLVTSHTYASSQAWTAAAGMTEAYDRFNLTAPGAGGQSTTGAFVAQPPAGPVAGKSAVAAGSADTGNAHIVALRPAPVNVVPGRFNAYDAPVAGIGPGVIKTKIAGSAMSLAIVALNAAGNAIEAGFSDNVQVDVVDASAGGAVDGNNCNAAWPVIATVPASWTVMLNSGSAVLGAVSVPNAYPNARIRIIYPVGAAYPGTAAGCSMDNFANRPASLTVVASDADWATPGAALGRTLDNTNPAASPVHKAGQPFRVTVTPQPASVTQYAGVPTVKTASCLTLAGMTGCANGALGLSAGDWSGNGTRINDNATYSEAGALTLELEDQNFANVDLADSTVLERTIPQTGGSGPVGRFVPDHFTVVPHPMGPAPQFQTFGAACAGARSFTYIGQSFGYVDLPRALVTARAAGGGTTTNYRESLWKITTAAPSDVTQTYSNNATGPALDLSLAGNAPMVVKQDDGTGIVTANAADRLFYTRDPAAAIAPFTANISLTISVRDDSESEGQIVTSPVATTFSGIAFDAGAGFRYGRLRLANANGSHLVPLQVPIETQYFLGPPSNTFATNAADQCTTLAATNITMGNFQANLGPLASCKTRMNPSITFANGRGNLQLSAPGNGNNGSVDLTVQLGAGGFGNTSCVVTPPPPPLQATTGANRLYLQGNWTGPTFDQNPTARATFGVFRGADEVIYIRENF